MARLTCLLLAGGCLFFLPTEAAISPCEHPPFDEEMMNPLGHPEWDEAADALAPLMGEGATVVLMNSTGDAVDEQRLAERIAAARGAERVTALHVHPSSRVRDLRFLRALPAL